MSPIPQKDLEIMKNLVSEYDKEHILSVIETLTFEETTNDNFEEINEVVDKYPIDNWLNYWRTTGYFKQQFSPFQMAAVSPTVKYDCIVCTPFEVASSSTTTDWKGIVGALPHNEIEVKIDRQVAATIPKGQNKLFAGKGTKVTIHVIANPQLPGLRTGKAVSVEILWL